MTASTLRDWQHFLTQHSASFGDFDGAPAVAAFGPSSPPGTNRCALVPLNPWGVLGIEGPDAARFLQQYATCDVEDLARAGSVEGALCNREGRAITSFRLWGARDALRLRMHAPLIEPTWALLATYIMFFKAELVDHREDRIGLGLTGPDAEIVLADALGTAPQVDQVLATEQGEAIRLPGSEPRFELWAPGTEGRALWTRLAESAEPVGHDTWLLAAIHAGRAAVTHSSSARYIPQMLNLHALDAISFSKGCYLGQEVVARMQHLGNLKQRLQGLRALDPGTGPAPSPGAEIRAPTGHGCGTVIMAAASEARIDLLAVVRSHEAEGALTLQDGTALETQPLPYAVSTDRAAAT